MTDNSSFGLEPVLKYAVRNYKFLTAATLVGTAVSVVVALLIPVKYKSTAVFFPAPSATISKVLMSDNFSTKTASVFGEEEEAEQFLQVLNSDLIRERCVAKYNLMQHYKIEGTSAYPYTDLAKEFYDNVSFKRTPYQAIQIDVMDTDKEIAAQMANDIAELADSVLIRIEKERSEKAFAIVQRAYFEKVSYVKMLEDSLNSTGYTSFATVSGSENKRLSPDKLPGNAKNAGASLKLQYLLEYETEQLSLLKARYDEAKVNAESELPHKYIVNRAYAAEKKTYPVRWLIVVLSAFGTFFMTLVVLLFVDSVRKIAWKE